MSKKKPIIIIGGSNGSGKTPLARMLMQALSLDHSLDTTSVRDILKSTLSPDSFPDLFRHSYQGSPAPEALRRQAELLRPGLQSCITRVASEGVSMVIEGVHMLPELYHESGADIFIMLAAPNPEKQEQGVRGSSHVHRQVSDDDMQGIIEVRRYLMNEAERYNIQVDQFSGTAEPFIARL